MTEQLRIRCAILRAGTSKGIFLMENDLSSDTQRRDQEILAIFGSPDVRQIDGLGGADPLTSKVAIIGPSTRSDADVNYTFGQVSIGTELVDFSGNCGNISSGVGPFAIDEGLVRAVEPVTKVRIHNTNTGKILVAEVPVKDGKAQVCGDYKIAGVPGTGAKIMLDFAGTVGSATNKMLPTGKVVDVLNIEDFGTLEASIIDVANPMVFVRAKDLGLTGIETPAQINGNKEMLDLLEKIRGKAATMIGMAKDEEDALKNSPAFPMIAFVSEPQDYVDFTTGKAIRADQVDFVSRLMYMQVIHKTYAGTGTTCTGAAAKIPGSIVNQVTLSKSPLVRIGHPAGVIDIEVQAKEEGAEIKLERAAFGRTARRIMDGYVYISR
ncbi:2-methylaconitate cis-trans isomerase PrpF family protein [Desulfosporosinus nitroreducens]|uniref:2-methylaconitate cis-trans isomerase PrpF family protein n=1 Tax=Desulfosporosinus nitroreducens TaxID=2018668 RepID=UPI00207D1534|nr:PrpF domain-containing protein [Desulfosporosinus nitroreducens]MCO1602377.1 3-methylitaconate isomerase [Desulfosporosinus nitroreducens]